MNDEGFYGVGLLMIFAVRTDARALIHRLLAFCRPSTIRWFVVSVVIDAIKRVSFGWTFAHIGQKLLELFPSRMHLNTTRYIDAVISAPVDHVCPRRVSERPLSDSRMTMMSGSGEAAFFLKTAATLRGSESQINTSDDSGYSAVALATVHDRSRFPVAWFFRPVLHDEPSKSAANHRVNFMYCHE